MPPGEESPGISHSRCPKLISTHPPVPSCCLPRLLVAALSFQGVWPKILTPPSHTHVRASPGNSLVSVCNVHRGSHHFPGVPAPSWAEPSPPPDGVVGAPSALVCLLLLSLCPSLLSTQAARRILLTHKVDQITFLLTSFP